MHPLLTEKHENYRQQIRIFAESEIKPIAGELDEKNCFSAEITKKMGKFGLFGITIPEQYGGKNLDTLSYIIAVEELARVDSSQSATVASHNSLGIGPVFQFGTDKQKQELLPGFCTGERLWAFGLTEETAGSDVRGTKTTAVLENGYWIINGSKLFITNSASELSFGSTLQVVTGERDGVKELSVILVPRDTPGYKCERILNKMLWRAADTGKLQFINCRVPEENILGKRGMGARIMLKILDSGRLAIAAMGLGLAQGAYEMALHYSRKREQFGRPIGKNQAISFKLAEMDMKLELARNTLYKACVMKDRNQPFEHDAAISKLYCSEIAKEIADQAVQIFGAYGLFKDNPIERFYRDQRILQIGEGTSEILKIVISKHLGLKNL
ncbi:MAG TPA: acyl-CoA dehydrogenase family protein [Bacteroidales bacterium]|jgi:alkylation response protein AidB-like acyl-CoA dehydrogenase|nr:acyl-CoA dehydrogenase family protein [Bacteroidales bacterium]